MTLFHHGSQSYEVAASAAAANARKILEDQIERGRSRAFAVIDQVQTQVITDRVVPAGKIEFRDHDTGVEVFAAGEDTGRVHPHAFGQVTTRAGLPAKYVRDLQDRGAWGQRLLAHNLRELYGHDDRRFLMRNVGDELRGFLSDRFRRMDSRPILEAFAQAVQAMGAVPIEGHALDTQVALKAVLPMVFEPVPNEVLSIGLMWGNSDFGKGANYLSLFVDRLWCTNFAIMNQCLRQVHLGKRLADDVAFSQKTYELDTAATASAIGDIARAELGPDRVHALLAAVKTAHEEKVDTTKALADLGQRLSKGEVEAVAETMRSGGIEQLPSGDNKWRLSNAISWVAGQTEDETRRLELQKEAGRLVPLAA